MEVFVGAVLTDNSDRIFLIKEDDKYKISKGRWNLPGGSVDSNENLLEAIIRETKEETGYKIKVNSLVGCYKCMKNDKNWLYIVFSVNVLSKKGKRVDPGVKRGKWLKAKEFIKINESKLVHPDMKLVYKIALEGTGLPIDSVKFIDYK